jgi:hypothetical protein
MSGAVDLGAVGLGTAGAGLVGSRDDGIGAVVAVEVRGESADENVVEFIAGEPVHVGPGLVEIGAVGFGAVELSRGRAELIIKLVKVGLVGICVFWLRIGCIPRTNVGSEELLDSSEDQITVNIQVFQRSNGFFKTRLVRSQYPPDAR